KQGVIGLITVPDFQYLANWDRNLARITERGTTTVEKFQPASGPQMPGIVASPRLATLLFQNEKKTATALYEAAYGGQPVESFALGPQKSLSLTVKIKSD